MSNKERGSMTVEAALVLPFVIFVVLAFLYLFKLLALQLDMQEALSEAASSISQYAYVFLEDQGEESDVKSEEENIDFQGIVENFASDQLVKEQVEVYFPNSNYYDVILKDNINYKNSNILSDNETIDIVTEYEIEIPVSLINIMSFHARQRVKTRAFIGSNEIMGNEDSSEDASSKEDEYVYITEYGTVYHVSADCTYLKPSIHECNFSEVGDRRNEGGAKYYACERCCKAGVSSGVVFITDDGTCYHVDKQCPGLKRLVQRVPLSSVADRKACSKCCSK